MSFDSRRLGPLALLLSIFAACGTSSSTPSGSTGSSQASCGDGACEGGETCSSCPTDCGECGVDAGLDAAPGDSGTDASPDAAGGSPVYPSVPVGPTGLDFYVSVAAGDDVNPGTAAKPWKTIQHAANAVTNGPTGVTVHVAPGIYPEGITMSVSGTAAARVVFQSDVRWGAHVDATKIYWGWQSTGDYVDIVGFEVSGAQGIGIGMGGSSCRTIDNHVHDVALPPATLPCNGGNGGAGIDDYNYAASDDEMIGNVVHDIGPDGCTTVQGLYHSNLGGRLVNNLVYRVSGYGIHTWHNPKNVVIANNLVFQSGAGGLIVGAGDSPGTGKAEGFVVTNNILFDNLGPGLREYGNVGVNTYVDNLVFQNGQGNTDLINPSMGELDVLPGLVSYLPDGSGDYHLGPSSPCIGSGTAQGAPSTDIEGFPRGSGAKQDRGPYVAK